MNALTKSSEQSSSVAEYSAGLMEVIARAASDPNVDIDKMERLIAMQERVQARDAAVAFNGALARLQPNLPIISERGGIKDRAGNVQSTYALWEDVNEAIRPLLAAEGFALRFKVSREGDQISVTGILSHSDGHSDETTLTLPTDTSGSKNAVQAVGSSTQYGKRYTAFALLNITSTGEDDDGASATHVIPAQVAQQQRRDAPFPQGPAKNKSELKTTGRDLWRDIESVEDIGSLEDLLTKGAPLIAQIKAALPTWWSGGEKDGNSFEGMEHVIDRVRRDLTASVDMPEYIQRGADIIQAG